MGKIDKINNEDWLKIYFRKILQSVCFKLNIRQKEIVSGQKLMPVLLRE